MVRYTATLLSCLTHGPQTKRALCRACLAARPLGYEGSIAELLARLVAQGRIVRVKHGVYALPGGV